MLDAQSGLEHSIIQEYLLACYVDLTDPSYGTNGKRDDTAAGAASQTSREIIKSVLSQSFGYPFSILETGSVAENVCLFNENHQYFDTTPEADIMVVINLDTITRGNHVIQDIEDSPGFFRVELTGEINPPYSHLGQTDGDIEAVIHEEENGKQYLSGDGIIGMAAIGFIMFLEFDLSPFFKTSYNLDGLSMEDLIKVERKGPSLMISTGTMPVHAFLERSSPDSERQVAVSERQVAVSERKDADSERQVAASERQDSDNERQDEDSERQDSDSERQVSVGERQDSDNEGQASDSERQDSDSERQVAVGERQDSDNEGQSADMERQDSDSERQVAVGERQDSDNEGPTADSERQDEDSERKDDDSEGSECELKDEIDCVIAIKLPSWPSQAAKWPNRQRVWPSPQKVEEITSKGAMAVVKVPPGGDPNRDWRLSFSEAEIILVSDREAPCRQQAYRIFKYIIKQHVVPPAALTSYHLKTILLWISERFPPDYWSWENLSNCYLGEFGYLLRQRRSTLHHPRKYFE